MIFCLGLPKTGTHSMKLALEILGLRVRYNNEDDWKALSKGKYLAGDYDATVHFGFHHGAYFKARYPDCKLILTTRDDWLDSAETAFSVTPKSKDFHNLTTKQQMTRLMAFGMLGFHREHFQRVYENQIKNHEGFIHRIEDGWGPLCEFLGKPVPDEEFPRLNVRT